jgi:serine/threonine protein kinase
MPLAAGVRLGPYEILAPLGAGGMCEVDRATDTRLGRTVAVKVLPHHLAHDPQRRERFEREARAVSSLNHPHICTLHDIGEQDGLHYLVMEYVEGETLAARLDRGRLPLDQALAYAIQIAEALDKAHGKAVVHRDLKPGNVMVTRAGVKLLDFGLAKLKEADAVPALSKLPTVAPSAPLTAEGTILGTLQYMLPSTSKAGTQMRERTSLRSAQWSTRW